MTPLRPVAEGKVTLGQDLGVPPPPPTGLGYAVGSTSLAVSSRKTILFFMKLDVYSDFLGGLSLHLNHLIAERMSTPYWQFGTLPIGIFLSNLVSGQLETSLMTSYCHF